MRITVVPTELLVAAACLREAADVAGELAVRAHGARGMLDGCGHPQLAEAGDCFLRGWSAVLAYLADAATGLGDVLVPASARYTEADDVSGPVHPGRAPS
jgi:hypothetical protein